jgi:hypothetical protein
MKVALNVLAKRHLDPNSGYSFFAGSEKALVETTERAMDAGQVVPGYMDGVMLVRPSPAGFLSGVVEVNKDTELFASFAARRKGEDPYIDNRAVGVALPAAFVDVVIYRHDVLVKDGDNSTDAEWEIVSVNARPTEEEEPQHPVSMARNHLGLVGGTKHEYTADELAKAIVYWSRHALRKT